MIMVYNIAWDKYRIIHGHMGIGNFSSIVQLNISPVSTANKWDIELTMRSEIPWLPLTINYFVHHTNILLTRSQLNSRLKKRTPCHSLMALNKAGDTSAADWLPQTRENNFSHAMIRFFSGVEIRIKHSSLFYKTFLSLPLFQVIFTHHLLKKLHFK